MPGLEVTEKLRRGLGRGDIVPVAELEKRLEPVDGDADGALTRDEFTEFLVTAGVGGPWFCQVLSGSFWRQNEQRLGRPSLTIEISRLAANLNLAMSRPPRPERRYDISPEAISSNAHVRSGDPLVRPPDLADTQPGRPSSLRAAATSQRDKPSLPGRASVAPLARASARRPQARRPGPRS